MNGSTIATGKGMHKL